MPAALERGGGAVGLPIAKALILALKEARVTGAEGLADAYCNPIAEALADPEVIPHPEILADSEVLPNPEVLPDPQTDSGPET